MSKRFERLVEKEVKPFVPTMFDQLAAIRGAKLPRYTVEVDGTHHWTKREAVTHLRQLVKGGDQHVGK